MIGDTGLRTIGNFSGYEPKPRIVVPRGIAATGDSSRIKLYSMFETGESEVDYSLAVDSLGQNVDKLLRDEEVTRGTGLGFAILSEEVLNISIWGGKNTPWLPSILTPNVFDFTDPLQPHKLVRAPQDMFGENSAYCAWECEIVGHEGKLWRNYMDSQRTVSDKEAYLEKFLEGQINP